MHALDEITLMTSYLVFHATTSTMYGPVGFLLLLLFSLEVLINMPKAYTSLKKKSIFKMKHVMKLQVGQSLCFTDNLADELLQPNVRDFIRDLHSGKYGVDQSLKPNDDIPQASFRKLNVT